MEFASNTRAVSRFGQETFFEMFQHFLFCPNKNLTVASNTIRALEIIRVKKLIPNAIFLNKYIVKS